MSWIIKDNRKKYKVECDICHSIIGFTKEDIIVNTGEYLGEYHSSSSIGCPACKTLILLSIDAERMIKIEDLD